MQWLLFYLITIGTVVRVVSMVRSELLASFVTIVSSFTIVKAVYATFVTEVKMFTAVEMVAIATVLSIYS